MRFREIIRLNEGVEKITVWSGATIPVLYNPTKIAFDNFTKRHRSLRGLLSYDGQNIWLWDGAAAVHSNLIQELGLEHIDCIGYSDGRWNGPVYDNYEYKAVIERLTPKPPADSAETDELLRQLSDPDALI